MSSQRQQAPSRTEEQTQEAPPEPQRTLRLVGDDSENRQRRVQWTEETVDNEHMNLKKSKICCIFHPKKEFDESSDDDTDYSSSSSSSSSSDSDSDSDTGAGAGQSDHGHCGHSHARKRRPNAYERAPRVRR